MSAEDPGLIAYHSSPITGDAGAVIVAAGSSTRMRGTHKLWADLCGEPLLARTLRAFQECAAVGRVVVVSSQEHAEAVRGLCATQGFSKVAQVCPGGANRQESVLAGLRVLGPCELVAVHDGARPLVTGVIILQGLDAARENGSALCAVRAKSTHKLVDERGAVLSTPPRESLWEAQTPQVFRYAELLAAHERAAETGTTYTDDAALMEAAGHTVRVYEGSYRNIKVTTPEDLTLVRALYQGTSDE
ncbi:MAG: 2-C-methyl-D-erythritol 4-phosphate cytidylyltransferase [Chloroflexota bacterium]|nr:2-C-methyl-D-erythritol 4-phosphate cytidylyltransferase [Chloroflexota bacterium]